MSDTPDDPRTTFLKSLPRKIVEIKATLGALIADPRSSRMRDELRRRLHALLTLARSYNLLSLADTLRGAEEILDASRPAPAVVSADIDRLTTLIASLPSRVERDVQATVPEDVPSVTLRGLIPPAVAPLGTTRTLFPPPGTRSDLPPTLALRPARKSSRPPVHPPFQLPTAALATAQSLLFAGGHVLAATLRSVLPAEIELLPTETLSDALFLARDTAPDIIVAETEPPADGISLLTALRADPLTDFLPVILLARSDESVDAVRSRCPEAAEVLTVSSDVSVLRAALERVLTGASQPPSTPDLGELTLDELSRALADEIRRGLVTSASARARNTRLSLGSGTEVLAATWEAIARIRELLEQQTQGAVRFDVNTAPRGLPGTHVFSLSDGGEFDAERSTEEDPLPGRKALVVDDDPKVVATFSALLTQAGMTVIEQSDGTSALRAARIARPDVIIADIVMPGIDGFSLCRALHRDVSLRHTPIILLSWKDDLLARMRELGAQAQGYLRKESTGEAILARVRSVLRGRTRILRRVTEVGAKGQVRGRIERVGAFPLVEAAAKALSNATITLADASSVTELEVREGKLVAAVRTAQDGGLVRGESALLQALGLSSGRFVVRQNSAASRTNLSGDLSTLLYQSARRISALEESLTGAALLEVGRVEMDPDAASAYGRSLTPALRDAVHGLIEGASPRDLVERGEFDLTGLESLLQELLRRGAIHRVLGANGEDLGAMRLAAPPDARPFPPRPSSLPAPFPASMTPIAPSNAPAPAAPQPDATTPAAPQPDALRETPVGPEPAEPVAPPPHAERPTPLPTSTPEQERETRPALEFSLRPTVRGRVETRADWLLPPAAAIDVPEAPTSARAAPILPGPTGPGDDDDSLADAVWRELRGVVDERRPGSDHAPRNELSPHHKSFTLQDFDLPPAPPEPLDDPPAPPQTAPAVEALSVVSLPEVQLAITTDAPGSLRPTEPEPSADATPAGPAIPPPTLKPPPAPESAPESASEGESSPSAPILLQGGKKPSGAPVHGPWETDPPREETGDPTADTYEFKSFPPPPPGTRNAPSGGASPPNDAPDEDAARTLAAMLARASALDSTPEAPLRPDAPPPDAPPAEAPAAPPTPPVAVEPPATSPEAPSGPPPPVAVSPRAEDPAPADEPTSKFNPRVTLKPLASPPDASPSTARTRNPWMALALLVAITFAGSYLAVRWYAQRHPELAPEPVIDLPPEPAPVSVDAATPAVDVAPTDAAAVVAPGINVDAAVDAPNTARVTDQDAATVYLPPTPFLDGGTLAPRMGLLVIRAPRRGASAVEVQIDQRVVGSAPVTAALTENLHTLRFRAGILTSYQFVTIRPGVALVIDAPSDH